MGTTAEKLTYLNETKNLLKNVINYSGAGLTTETFREYPQKLYDKYLDILKDDGAELFSTLPQVTDSGTTISLNDTVNTKMNLELYPSALEQETTTGKNLNFTPYTNGISKTTNGITFTVNNEGEVIANGTSTATAYFYLHTQDIQPYWNLPKETYAINGCPNGGGNSTYSLGLALFNNTQRVTGTNDYGNGATINTTQYDYNRVLFFIVIASGITCNNLKFQPMVRLSSISDDTYEPYTNGPSPNPDYPQDVHTISGDNTIVISNSDNTETQSLPLKLGVLEFCKIGNYSDEFYKATANDTGLIEGEWYIKKNVGKITSYNGESITTTYISTTGGLDSGATVYYGLTTPTYELLNDTLQKELNNMKKAVSYDTQTNISQINSDLSFVINATAIEKNGGA